MASPPSSIQEKAIGFLSQTKFWHSSPLGPSVPFAIFEVSGAATIGVPRPVPSSDESQREVRAWVTCKYPHTAWSTSRCWPPPPGNALSVPATSSRAFSRGEEFPRTPSDSSNISARPRPPRLAITNTRRLRWATPKYLLSKVFHVPIYPSFSNPRMRTAKSRPPLLEKSPGTFSTTTHCGSSSPTILRYSCHSPLLPPAKPRRFPATDRSWQGNPPQMRSGRTSKVVFVIFLTSFILFTSGQWRRRTALACGSISHWPMQFIPARSNPRSKPPIPENNER